MIVKFIAALPYLNLDGTSMIRFGKGHFIRKLTTEEVNSFVGEDFAAQIGGIRLGRMFNKNCLIGSYVIEFDKNYDPQIALVNFLYQFTQEITTFSDCLWLVKDNSVHVDEFYYYGSDENGVYYGLLDVEQHNSNCYGKFEYVDFNPTEVARAETLINRFKDIHTTNKSGAITGEKESVINRYLEADGSLILNNPIPDLYNDNSRIERGALYLRKAKAEIFLPLKISFYMAYFECLFSTDNSGVSHKICERVALYIGLGFEDRNEIFSKIKAAYNIRSRYVHGDILGDESENRKEKKKVTTEFQESLCERIDCYARKSFEKIIEHDSHIFLSSMNILEDYFKKMLLAK